MTRKASPKSKHEADDLDNLPKDLADAIDRLPILKMIHSADLPDRGMSKRKDPVDELNYQARTVFWRLRILAELGNESAIKTLRDLGVHVANTLKDIARAQRPDPSSRATKTAKPRTPDVINLRGDFSQINYLLETRLDEFVNQFQPIGGQPLYQGFGSPRKFVVDAIESLHWRNDRARKLRASMAHSGTDAFALSYPPMLLRMLSEPEPSNESQSEMEIDRMAKEGAIHDAIRRRLERRLARLAPKAAAKKCRKVASESLLWPTCYSTISEEQNAYKVACEDLHPGEAIPFRLHHKSGRPRKLDPDSPTRFALDYCHELYVTRESLRSDRHRLASLNKKSPDSKSQEIKQGRTLDEDESEGRTWLLGFVRRALELNDAWELAASKLPDFSHSKDAEKSSASLAAWHDAAMLRAEAECNGEWDGYMKWPSCVTKRAAEKKRRSYKEAVSFCLKRGIQNLKQLEDGGGDRCS